MEAIAWMVIANVQPDTTEPIANIRHLAVVAVVAVVQALAR
jgi:hypothetical protein